MKLYHYPLSGHSHRARLFLALADIPHELVEIDLSKKAHKTAAFLKLNPFGQLPILEDAGAVIPDSIAIMVYAAKKFAKVRWLPEDPFEAAAVQRWLSVAAGQIYYGPCAARLITVFGYKFDAAEAIARSHAILRIIDAELDGREWIALSDPTIADVGLYSYISSAPEGNVDIAPYANVGAWLRRVESLPGFVPFQKTAIGLAA
jgi:glutathione S-transferase